MPIPGSGLTTSLPLRVGPVFGSPVDLQQSTTQLSLANPERWICHPILADRQAAWDSSLHLLSSSAACLRQPAAAAQPGPRPSRRPRSEWHWARTVHTLSLLRTAPWY